MMTRTGRAMVGIAFLLLASVRLAAQMPVLKDPDEARKNALLFPGGGHFYTGEYLRGGAMLGASVYAGLQVVRTLVCGSTNKNDYTYSGDCPAGGALLWLGVIAAAYVYGIYDAPASTERVNGAAKSQAFKPSAYIDVDQNGRIKLGLSLRTR